MQGTREMGLHVQEKHTHNMEYLTWTVKWARILTFNEI